MIEAIGFARLQCSAGNAAGDAGRLWLAGLANGAVHEDVVGAG